MLMDRLVRSSLGSLMPSHVLGQLLGEGHLQIANFPQHLRLRRAFHHAQEDTLFHSQVSCCLTTLKFSASALQVS